MRIYWEIFTVPEESFELRRGSSNRKSNYRDRVYRILYETAKTAGVKITCSKDRYFDIFFLQHFFLHPNTTHLPTILFKNSLLSSVPNKIEMSFINK